MAQASATLHLSAQRGLIHKEGIRNWTLLGMTLLVMEVLLFILALYQYLTLPQAFVCHVLLVMLFSYFAHRLGCLVQNAGITYLLLLCTLMLGALGTVGALVTVLLYLYYRRGALPFEDWYESLFPEEQHSLAETIYRDLTTSRQSSGKEGGVAPFIDIIDSGTRKQKQGILTLISKRFAPQFAPALKRAMRDRDNTIRILATTAVTRIEDAFLKRAIELDKAVQQHPHDLELLLHMARHYDDHAFTGLLDRERERANRNLALEGYMNYLRQRPQDASVRRAVGRVLMRGHDDLAARLWFEEAMRDLPQTNAEILMWYMESLYRLGDYQALRQMAADKIDWLQEQGALPDPVLATLQLWAGRTTEIAV